LVAQHGDLDFVYADMDTGYYFELIETDVALHRFPKASKEFLCAIPAIGYGSNELEIADRRLFANDAEIVR